MIVEVVAVGTELLLGQIVNTNVADIGKRMVEDGFDVNYQVTVGDNLDRLVETIRTATTRADAVILTGGIGPTQDDMTRDAICVVIDSEIMRDEAHETMIRERLAARGVVADSALRMADYPADATPLPNSKGVALGIAAEFDGTPIFAVPGVPTEMRAMIDEQVRPRLRSATGEPSVLINRVLHTWGLGESQISEKLDDLYDSTNPSVAFLINGPEVRIRITAKDATTESALAMIADIENVIRERLGYAVFAVDGETVDAIIADYLEDLSWTVSTIEALTAGQLATRLSASKWFAGGTVVATPNTAPSESKELEEHALALLESHAGSADVHLAVSAATGQRSGDGVAARRLAIGIRTPETTTTRTIDILGDDERARSFAVPGALHVLRQTLSERSN